MFAVEVCSLWLELQVWWTFVHWWLIIQTTQVYYIIMLLNITSLELHGRTLENRSCSNNKKEKQLYSIYYNKPDKWYYHSYNLTEMKHIWQCAFTYNRNHISLKMNLNTSLTHHKTKTMVRHYWHRAWDHPNCTLSSLWELPGSSTWQVVQCMC